MQKGDTEDRGAPGWLVEWDGGWETVDSPEAGEEFIEEKIAEWDGADRSEFAIVPNRPTDR